MSEALATRSSLYGLEIDALTLDEVVARCEKAVNDHSRMLLGVVNAAKVVKLRKDPLLRESLLDCDLLLADGQPVVWASKLFGSPLPERVAGIDLFDRLLALAHRDGRSVYLLGAKKSVLAALLDKIEDRYPGLKVAGSRDGYFSVDESAAVAAEIRASGADMLFLGITSPKKEIFLSSFGPSLHVPVLHGVGGSFDVMAGVTKRAPLSWQHVGMEWAYRLLQEPRRMWRRYLTTNSEFIYRTVRELLKPTLPYRRK